MFVAKTVLQIAPWQKLTMLAMSKKTCLGNFYSSKLKLLLLILTSNACQMHDSWSVMDGHAIVNQSAVVLMFVTIMSDFVLCIGPQLRHLWIRQCHHMHANKLTADMMPDELLFLWRHCQNSFLHLGSWCAFSMCSPRCSTAEHIQTAKQNNSGTFQFFFFSPLALWKTSF